MVTTYETLALMISFSSLVLLIVNTSVQLSRSRRRRRHHKNTKK